MPAQDTPAIDPKRSATLAEFGATLTPLEPIGAAVRGLDLASPVLLPRPVVQALEYTMAERGFVVFKNSSPLSATDFLQASCWWGRQGTAQHPRCASGNTRGQPASLSSVQRSPSRHQGRRTAVA